MSKYTFIYEKTLHHFNSYFIIGKNVDENSKLCMKTICKL